MKLQQQLEHLIADANSDENEILFALKKIVQENEIAEVRLINTSSINTIVAENIEHIQSPNNSRNGVFTGFKDIDTTIGGFNFGEMVVIAARPGMGKTTMLINLALNISEQVPILFCSLEMSEQQVANRIIAILSDLSLHKIAHNMLADFEKEKISGITEQLKKHQLFVSDTNGQSISLFKAYCQKQIKEKGIKVIVIDYIQMMSSNRYRHNRELEMSYISRSLKQIAQELNICLIVSSQLSRAVETRGGVKRPMLSDLRESGAIEQDADKVIFLYRPDYYGQEVDENNQSVIGKTELIFAKNRTGMIDTFAIKFIAHIPTMVDYYEDEIKNSHYQNFTTIQSGSFNFSVNRLSELKGGKIDSPDGEPPF